MGLKYPKKIWYVEDFSTSQKIRRYYKTKHLAELAAEAWKIIGGRSAYITTGFDWIFDSMSKELAEQYVENLKYTKDIKVKFASKPELRLMNEIIGLATKK